MFRFKRSEVPSRAADQLVLSRCPDLELRVDQEKECDSGALELLFRQHGPMVLVTVRSLLGPRVASWRGS